MVTNCAVRQAADDFAKKNKLRKLGDSKEAAAKWAAFYPDEAGVLWPKPTILRVLSDINICRDRLVHAEHSHFLSKMDVSTDFSRSGSCGPEHRSMQRLARPCKPLTLPVFVTRRRLVRKMVPRSSEP